MEYIHVKSLEKYHPGYKDRTLQWAKIYINLADGDPDTELIDNEIDWARFIKLILLELRAQKPLPNSDSYWQRKGFDLKIRPMSLTIQMLHNFLEVVTDLGETVTNPLHRVRADKIRVRVDKNGFCNEFESLWNEYPSKTGKKEAQRHFGTSVKTQQDLVDIQTALSNYKDSKRVKGGFIQNGGTWFNNWRDWVISPEPAPKTGIEAYIKD